MTLRLELEPIITLPWLIRLRWGFITGQVLLLPVAHLWFHVGVDLAIIAVEVALLAGSNLALAALGRRIRGSRARIVGAVMVLDTALLTLLLAGTGGSANPFTVLYLVHITLSAVVLSASWVAAIAATSLVGFGVLFALPHDHAMMQMAQHLHTMWIAFAVAAVLIAFFVGKVTREIASQRDQIAALREQSERNERLASVTRLAAGAAHELGSPLGTIAVAAHEAKLHLRTAPETVERDLDLIATEIERCQDILHHLSTHSADTREVITLAAFAEAIRDQLDEASSVRVDVAVDSPVELVAPRDQLLQSVVALVDNALEATVDRVRVALVGDGRDVEICVSDRGDGISDEVLARIGAPFFTTKGAGRGLGLGVFLARAFCESRGGTLTIASTRGHGTRATIRIPAECAA